MYAVIRFQAIAKARVGNAYPDHVLLVFGFLTLFVGVIFMVRRGNFKRLFAYSSIEHMGIVAVALGFGGVLGLYGALCRCSTMPSEKQSFFLSSGDFVLGYKTRESSEVRGALGALPLAGGVLVSPPLAVAGCPPFGVFLSELTIVRAGFAGTPPVLAGGLSPPTRRRLHRPRRHGPGHGNRRRPGAASSLPSPLWRILPRSRSSAGLAFRSPRRLDPGRTETKS